MFGVSSMLATRRRAPAGGAAPTISSTNYDQVDTAGGGAAVVLTGTNMAGVTSVDHGGTSVSPTSTTSTTVTYTAPAKSSGTYAVTVTSPDGTSGSISIESFSPSASLTMQGHWRANSTTGYSVSSGNGTWLDVSGNGRNATHATLAPVAGTPVNGHTPPDPAGGSGGGVGARLTTATTLGTFFGGATANRTFVFGLLKADTFTSNGTNFVGAPLMNDDGGFFALGLAGSGSSGNAYFYQWDANADECLGAVSTGVWYAVVGWFDTTHLNMQVNGAAATPVAHAGTSSSGTTFYLMRNYAAGSPAHDGPCLEAGITGNQTYGATEALKVLKYMRQRYALALT